jgi:tetratricopeptide (TPR) repeat protein
MQQLRDLVKSEYDRNSGQLPVYLVKDAVAWNLLGRAFLAGNDGPESRTNRFRLAEKAFHKSVELDSQLASPHAGLAMVFLVGATGSDGSYKRIALNLAERELGTYVALDPDSRPSFLYGLLECQRGNFQKAEEHLRKAIEDDPHPAQAALLYAQAVISQETHPNGWASATANLVIRFPDNGALHSMHALALARDERLSDARAEMRKASALGVDPKTVIGSSAVEAIRTVTGRELVALFGWTMLYFAVIYFAIMLFMSGAGAVLAIVSGGAPPPPSSLGNGATPWPRRSLIAGTYILAIIVSLILFYVAHWEFSTESSCSAGFRSSS